MKLLLHIDSLARGGSQQQLVNLAIGMAQRSHDVTIVTYAPGNAHEAELACAGVSTHCTDKRHRFDLKPVVNLFRFIKTVKPDCIIAFLRTPCFYATLVRIGSLGTPLIVSERAGLVGGKLRPLDKVAGVFHLFASRVNANSRSYLNGLCTFNPLISNRSSVVYNGVASVYFEAGAALVDVRNKTDWDEIRVVDSQNESSNTIKLLVVSARPTKDKGLFVLIEALASIVATGRKNIKVYWAGPCDPSHPLVNAEEMAAALDMIVSQGVSDYWCWLGPTSILHAVYNQYDALLLPSLHEGTPNAMCEAMSCALPVVVSDIADNSELVSDGVHGFVCQVNSVPALMTAIEKICLLSPRQRAQMGSNAYSRAKKLFSMRTFVDSWESLISNTVHSAHN